MNWRRALGVAALFSLSCSSTDRSALVVAVSAEPKIPVEISRMEIRITRGNVNKFAQVYDLKAGEQLPGTLTLTRDDESSTEPVVVRISASLGPNKPWRVVREARLSFVDQKSKLLRLPLRYSCLDAPSVCKDGETCIGGKCRPADVDAEGLPEFQGSNQVVVKTSATTPAPTSSTTDADCFPVDACFHSPVDIPFSDAECSFRAPGPVGSFNLAMRWKQTPGHLAIVEEDPFEGFDLKADRITLSEGLCQALKDGRAIEVVASKDCATKDPDQPLCAIEAPPRKTPASPRPRSATARTMTATASSTTTSPTPPPSVPPPAWAAAAAVAPSASMASTSASRSSRSPRSATASTMTAMARSTRPAPAPSAPPPPVTSAPTAPQTSGNVAPARNPAPAACPAPARAPSAPPRRNATGLTITATASSTRAASKAAQAARAATDRAGSAATARAATAAQAATSARAATAARAATSARAATAAQAATAARAATAERAAMRARAATAERAAMRGQAGPTPAPGAWPPWCIALILRTTRARPTSTRIRAIAAAAGTPA